MVRGKMRAVELDCGVQHYAWGDRRFLPALLGIDNPDEQPFAELWMGTHPDLPAKARWDDSWIALDELIRSAPDDVLGREVARQYDGKLPFLFKVLSAAAPLSIQVHPSKERAREGFARENAAGIPFSAKERNYKDENHKPELLVALTEFYGLRGFRPWDEIARTLEEVPELRRLGERFECDSESLKKLYETFMQRAPEGVDSVLEPLVRRLADENEKRAFSRESREYWILRADRGFSTGGHRDRGLLSFYLLNLIHLQPGEAVFLSAGVLHAYLEGAGMEIMANSNNVLRGGLTPKHVDVPELLANVVFEGGPAEVLRAVPTERGEWIYPTPAREFELSRIEIGPGRPYTGGTDHNVAIILPIDTTAGNAVTVGFEDGSLALPRGRAGLIPHGLPYTVHADYPATLFRATVPDPGPRK